ncbi:MAG: putative porin, partial [Woeseiaceae bacterium]
MRKLLIMLLASIVLTSNSAFAAVSDDDFAQLRQELLELAQRVEVLAAENERLRQSQTEAEGDVAEIRTDMSAIRESGGQDTGEEWSDRVSLNGDFRYRFESIDPEGQPSRSRNRIRARANIAAELADNLDVGFGLATGGEDPVSTNQTLGNGGSSKNVVLNLAYVDWRPTEELQVLAGKYKNPLVRVGGQPLMFDGDWTPEGFALAYKRDWFFANGIGTFLESDSRQSNDNFSWGTQFGAVGEFGDVRVRGGLGYYSIKVAGRATTFGDPSDPGDFYGNTAVEPGGLACGTTPGVDCVFLYDYLLTEVFGEATFDLGDWPTAVFFDYVNNSDPSDNNTGWSAGARIGSASDLGQKRFTYYYADKGADSTIGLLTDSDFGGGGTDSKGHFLQFEYGIS